MAPDNGPVTFREQDTKKKSKVRQGKEGGEIVADGYLTPSQAEGGALPERPSIDQGGALDDSAEAQALPAQARPSPPDPFDPASLRLGADYSEGLGVRKVITTVPNRKPNKSEWFQVRQGEEWRLQTAVLELEKGVERSTYLVSPALRAELSGEIVPALLLICVNRAGDLFLWRVKLPGPDGRSNTWTDSALQIAKAAENNWCRMVSDTANGIYTHYEPAAVLPNPQWPDLSFPEILKLAFRGRMIDSLDHPVLRELRGDL